MRCPKQTSGVRWLPLLLTGGMLLPFTQQAWAQSDRIEIVGDYRYTYHDPETPTEAKATACREALRLAISTWPSFREETAAIVDSALLKDIVQTIASNYVKDVQVIEQAEKGRTVYCKVRGVVQSGEIRKVIQAPLGGVENAPTAVEQNRALRVLSVREDTDGTISVVFKALKRLDWLNTAYDGGLREHADLMVDFYDEQGTLIRSERYPARKTESGDDVMNPGEIGVRKIAKPLNAKSYRVWVVK
ncbi:MAG TPA: hypothetical protein VNK46_00580 [Nitrospiraceae bacterium]|jgi:hypothetical protein|nr:hypothetical protein [Nitrospiraceae bacterium]